MKDKLSDNILNTYEICKKIIGNGGEIMTAKEGPKYIEYMCSYCGKKSTRPPLAGRPAPGTCPRKANGGPHSWRINRKY